MPLPLRTCDYAECGETFVPKRKDQRFHTPACKDAWFKDHYRQTPHACPKCGAIHDPEEGLFLDVVQHILANPEGYKDSYLMDEIAAAAYRRREILRGVGLGTSSELL